MRQLPSVGRCVLATLSYRAVTTQLRHADVIPGITWDFQQVDRNEDQRTDNQSKSNENWFGQGK